MAWANGPLVLYHGTDDRSAQNIMQNGVDLNYCKALSDFGRGFYLTTWLHQAKNWANVRCRRLRRSAPTRPPIATVLSYAIDRAEIARPEVLVFISEGSNPDYWDLVEHCRLGRSGGHLLRRGSYYDVV
jgi:hypothetical protein